MKQLRIPMQGILDFNKEEHGMSLNATPSSERIHIGFFGRRNAGKSSLVNAVTGQNLSVVSNVAGTTTDPVKKAMELLPLGPVVMIDTPGLDDEGSLGELRIQKAEAMLQNVNLAVVVVDATIGMKEEEEKLLTMLQNRKIPYLIAMNKADLSPQNVEKAGLESVPTVWVSAATGYHVQELKEKLARLGMAQKSERVLVRDLLEPGDLVVLVVPIDEAAPKGRLILPQQQTIRDILDAGAISVVCKEDELEITLRKLCTKPRLVITDSQAFHKVSSIVPREVLLTSFSILFARYKGELDVLRKGVFALDTLKDGDKILMAEGCTHHRQCGDIGSVKIPALIRKTTGKNPVFEFTSGGDFPKNLEDYALVIHCGGCTLTEQMMKTRLQTCETMGVPVTNYGMAIAHMNGILERSMEVFGEQRGMKV